MVTIKTVMVEKSTHFCFYSVYYRTIFWRWIYTLLSEKKFYF